MTSKECAEYVISRYEKILEPFVMERQFLRGLAIKCANIDVSQIIHDVSCVMTEGEHHTSKRNYQLEVEKELIQAK